MTEFIQRVIEVVDGHVNKLETEGKRVFIAHVYSQLEVAQEHVWDESGADGSPQLASLR